MSRYSTALSPLTEAAWLMAMQEHTGPEDGFAGTFKAKAKAMNLWEYARCIHEATPGNFKVAAGISVRCSKRSPNRVANLQLLHTFHAYRRQGLGKRLVESEFQRVVDYERCEYFRVSSEENALPFYRSLGFRFWGAQKSGTCLSIFRIVGPHIVGGDYDPNDPIIHRAVFSKARGGVVNLFEEGPC